jgi:dTMP kinase
MRGKLIVIDGTDGTGKRTHSERLVVLLKERGYNAVRMDFPRYGQRSAALVEDYLNGKFGSASAVTPYQASIFYAADRYAASFEMRKILEEGTIIVCDRYVSANMGHQAGKIHDTEKRDEFLAWLEELEFGIFNIPRPDMNILLYMNPVLAQQFVDQKGLREYIQGGGKRDIHEDDLHHLEHAAKAFLYVANKYGWRVVECSDGMQARPVVDISHELLDMVLSELREVDPSNNNP